MSLPVAFHRLATRDLVQARRWYEERETGLGDRFFGVVHQVVEQVSRWPNAATPVMRDSGGEVLERAVVTPGFPFVVRYRVRNGVLVVIAVYHQRRRPGFGSDRG